MSDWIYCETRLPVINENNWRTDKALPIITDQLGLTYAYYCVTPDGINFWKESHIYGNAYGEICDNKLSRKEITCNVIKWMDIFERVS